MRTFCVAAVLLALSGCGNGSVSPSTPEEKEIRDRILEEAHDPSSVVFASWKTEIRKTTAEGHQITTTVVDVDYRAKNTQGALEFHKERWARSQVDTGYTVGWLINTGR